MRFDYALTRSFIIILIVQTSITIRYEGSCGQARQIQTYGANQGVIEIVNNIHEYAGFDGLFWEARPGRWPWHAGIYEYGNEEYENLTNICCGTIISPHVIITAAKCVYDQVQLKAKDPSRFRVAVGKLFYDWNEPDKNAQELRVSSIHISDGYFGNITSYEQNIALLGLSNDIEFNTAVRPVCLDWTGIGINGSESLAKVAGWGIWNKPDYDRKLKVNRVEYINQKDCIKSFSESSLVSYLNFDKFCIFSHRGRKDGDTGTGVVFSNHGISYIEGIMDANIESEFILATNVTMHLSWIKSRIDDIDKEKRCPVGFKCFSSDVCIETERKCDSIKDCEDGSDENETNCEKGENNGTCVLPYQRGGALYKILGCPKDDKKCILKPLHRIAINAKCRIECGLGYAPRDDITDLAICTSDGLFPDDPKCIKLCSSLRAENVYVACTYKGNKVKCNDYMRPGTIANYDCKRFYRVKEPLLFSGVSQCLSTGEWSKPLPDCVPECGLMNNVNDAMSTDAGGSESTYGKYPWHVGIYQEFDFNSSYVNICGGTIITTNIVLTAAHCFFDKTTKIQIDIESIRVAAGKFKRDWYAEEEYVKKLILPHTYKGFENQYEHDIALLDVTYKFTLDDFVLPVCLDWNGNGLKAGTNGTIIGWGLTEKQVFSENLQEITLPITDIVTCRNTFEFFAAFLTYDKFCAIYKEEFGGARVGDSGGSMTFPNGDLYYAYGIVSLKPTRDDRFGALTNVSEHVNWIKQQLRTHSRSLF